MLCRYERTIFQAQSGFCIMSYRTEDTSVPEEARNHHQIDSKYIHFTAVGYHLPETDQIKVNLAGTWKPSKYGLQLNVDHFDQVQPQNQDETVAFLSSGLLKGVGPGTARKIVNTFGARTMEILDHDPNQLLKVRGIAETKLRKIVASYRETVGLRDLVSYLAPYGVSSKKALKIVEVFGDASLQVVKSDPFQLTKVKGFAFLTVDALARKLNVSLQHPLRYSGAIRYVLEEAKSQGHLFLQGPELIERCRELLNRDLRQELVTEQDIRRAICRERDGRSIYIEHTRVYLINERVFEVGVAKRVVQMLTDHNFKPIRQIDRKITKAEQCLGYALSPSQRGAVESCLSNECSIMTGGPGTGKTTTLRVILSIYQEAHPKNEILLVAPTGRASRRMSDQTGLPAATLHSALGIVTDEDTEKSGAECLFHDLIVVDEFSMVDMHLAYALFQRIKPGAQIIMVGDPDQLPSVGAGNVLREFLRCRIIPTAVLESVFRQASNSNIYLNAQAINQNDTHLNYGGDFQMLGADDGEQAAQMVVQTYLREIQQFGIEGVQILTPFRRKGTTSANNLNDQIRDLVNPARPKIQEISSSQHTFRMGDRIIQTCNREDVSNGDVGVITKIIEEGGEAKAIVQMYDGREVTYSQEMMEDLDYSYCMTIHKSQGSEYPCVIMPLLKEHHIMLRRNLLYTGITRAKEKVILIGQKQAVYTAVHRNDIDKRNTVLADRVLAYYAREEKKIRS